MQEPEKCFFVFSKWHIIAMSKAKKHHSSLHYKKNLPTTFFMGFTLNNSYIFRNLELRIKWARKNKDNNRNEMTWLDLEWMTKIKR